MNKKDQFASSYTLILGWFLFAQGVWGLSSTILFKVFTVNATLAVVYLVLGTTGILFAVSSKGRNYCKYIAPILLLIGIARLVPDLDLVVLRVLNMNREGALLNIGISVLSLLVAALSRPSSVLESRPLQIAEQE